jgi:transcription initiation factor TFIID subunit 2
MEKLSALSPRDISVAHQKVDLTVEPGGFLKGVTTLTVIPNLPIKSFRLNSRCEVLRVFVNNRIATFEYQPPSYDARNFPSVHQHHLLRKKLTRESQELLITLPKSIKIEEIESQGAITRVDSAISVKATELSAAVTGPTLSSKVEDSLPKFKPLDVRIHFETKQPRDGICFSGWDEGDRTYPHIYTTSGRLPGKIRYVFPCLDTLWSRCTWELNIIVPRTLGHALKKVQTKTNNLYSTLSEEEKLMDMTVVCSGELSDEVVSVEDDKLKTTSFVCTSSIAARHIGFAIGPFEHFDLSEFRDVEEDDRLGESAIAVHGYCLPGRSIEMRNTCMPMAKAIDFYTMTYGSFPFADFKICFVDDMETEMVETASLSLCSNRLLFPEDLIDPIDPVTRKLCVSLATQWIGIDIIPNEMTDFWIILGIAYFMADQFLKRLFGNNDFRFRQKKASNLVCETDIRRPSLYELGNLVGLDKSEEDFIALKAPLVLWILDRRLAKTGGSAGCNRIISRILLNAKVGSLQDNALATSFFIRTSEKLGHTKLDVFFQQWVYGAGCPWFVITQRFNKKKLLIEVTIDQTQPVESLRRLNSKYTFLRDIQEDRLQVEYAPVQNVFTGPMTIRIHEADGTPYEHIIEIKERRVRQDIPYNTKYKRLKRTRRQKEKAAIAAGVDASELQEDVLLYSLGDTLQTDQEIAEWKLADWTKADEDAMNNESFEWMRVDADFEWIAIINNSQSPWMYLSQLQQDRDVIAQLETIHYIAGAVPTPVYSSILVRTLMDRRYFHGIRTEAAHVLAQRQSVPQLQDIGFFHLDKAFQSLYCYPGTNLPRPNDFSDRLSYIIQCAIVNAISLIRHPDGKVPIQAKRFLLEKLKLNDNSNNQFSDVHYVSHLLNGLCQTMLPAPQSLRTELTFEGDTDELEELRIQQGAIAEIEQYRRSDEWSSSYQNILSRTAIDCLQKLSSANLIPVNRRLYLQYLREDTSEFIRLAAVNSLVNLGLFEDERTTRFFFYLCGNSPSSFFRHNLIRLLGQGIGAIAIGERKKELEKQKTESSENDGMIIEDESTAQVQAKADDIDRQESITAAASALKTELASNMAFEKGIWSVIQTSKFLSHPQIESLLHICELLYDTDDASVVKLRYPRYYAVKHLGQGKLVFSRSNKIRTKMRRPMTVLLPTPTTEAPKLSIAPPVKQTIKLSVSANHTPVSASNGNFLAAPTAASPAKVASSTAPTKKRKTPEPEARPTLSKPIKLKINPLKLSLKTAAVNGTATSSKTASPAASSKATPAAGSPGTTSDMTHVKKKAKSDSSSKKDQPPPTPASATSGFKLKLKLGGGSSK